MVVHGAKKWSPAVSLKGIASHIIWLRDVSLLGMRTFSCSVFQQASKHNIFEQKTAVQ